VDQPRKAWERFAGTAASFDEFQAGLPGFIDRLATFPRERDPLSCPRGAVTGDFSTRFSPLFMEGIAVDNVRAFLAGQPQNAVN
jgi:hypothetical protein